MRCPISSFDLNNTTLVYYLQGFFDIFFLNFFRINLVYFCQIPPSSASKILLYEYLCPKSGILSSAGKIFLRFLQSIGSKNLAHKNIFPLFLTIGKDGPLCRKSHTSSPPKILPLIPLCRPVATAKMKLRNARPSIRANRKPEIIDS